MGVFKKFSIPPKEPELSDDGKYICNARMRAGGQELHCPEKVDGPSRCDEHNIGKRLRAAKEESRRQKVVDEDTVGERAKEILKDRRNLTRLDGLVANSLVILNELEARYPVNTIEPQDARMIAVLREKHAELVKRRVEVEVKLKTLLDAEVVLDKAKDLFEESVSDANTFNTLIMGLASILDDVSKSGHRRSE